MRAGDLRQQVSLSRCPQTSPDSDGFFEDLTPRDWRASILPNAPSEDGRRITHLVTMRYHPQVNMDTRIVYTEQGTTHQLFVRSFQDVEQRHVELRCLCEEIIP